jgi:hypothetical protein
MTKQDLLLLMSVLFTGLGAGLLSAMLIVEVTVLVFAAVFCLGISSGAIFAFAMLRVME